MEPLVKNAGDEEQIRKAGDKVAQRRKRELLDIERLMASAEGRRFIWRVLSLSGMFSSAVSDEEGLFYAKGRAYIGLRVWGDLRELAPQVFADIMAEAKTSGDAT